MSTIHKAKGREFDNVFIMLENFNATTDSAKRQLYVAMTRAKQTLTIHLNSNFLNNLTAEHLERIEDKEMYSQPNELVMHLFLKDVWLDYFINRQHLVDPFISGDTLKINEDECLDANGKSVLKFSKNFVTQIGTMKAKNYELKSAKVNFIVYWKKEDTEQEIKIILPELLFERK